MRSLPTTITARLGEDFNWWVEQLEDRPADTPASAFGLLDPRQLRHLLDTLPGYAPHGLDLELFRRAFQPFVLDAEVAEGCLRLAAVEAELEGEAEMFALPRLDPDGDGPFYDFLDALGAARVKHLNATHDYACDCTVDDMQEELDAMDQDRYFSADNRHVFDQINEILEWRPAEWDDSD